MSGSREGPKAMRPSLPDAAESPEESGVKKHFHDNHSSDLKISGPENLQDCIQQEAANSSQSSSGKRRLRLTSEQPKETKRKSKLPPVQLFEGHYIYSPSVRVRNIHVKQSDLDKKNLLEGLSDQGLITRHQESGHEEMPEAKRLNVSIVNDADMDPEIEVIMDGGGTSSSQFIELDTCEVEVLDFDDVIDITPVCQKDPIHVTDPVPTPTALLALLARQQTAEVLLQQTLLLPKRRTLPRNQTQPAQPGDSQHVAQVLHIPEDQITDPHDLDIVRDNMVLNQVKVKTSISYFNFTG